MNPERLLLDEAGLRHVRPGVWARTGLEDILPILSKTDLFITDFDECVTPHISQATAAFHVIRKVADNLNEPGHVFLLANLAFNAGVLIARKTYQKISGDIQNSRLIMGYEKMIKGAPMGYFNEASLSMSDSFFSGVADTFLLLNRKNIPLGVVSLGMAPIIKEMLDNLEQTAGAKADFIDATEISIDDMGRFMSYDPEKTHTGNEDKKFRLRERAAAFNAKHVVAVGHDRDDMKLFEESRRTGGVSMGFRPAPVTYPLLDIAVFAPDWQPIHELFMEALENG